MRGQQKWPAVGSLQATACSLRRERYRMQPSVHRYNVSASLCRVTAITHTWPFSSVFGSSGSCPLSGSMLREARISRIRSIVSSRVLKLSICNFSSTLLAHSAPTNRGKQVRPPLWCEQQKCSALGSLQAIDVFKLFLPRVNVLVKVVGSD